MALGGSSRLSMVPWTVRGHNHATKAIIVFCDLKGAVMIGSSVTLQFLQRGTTPHEQNEHDFAHFLAPTQAAQVQPSMLSESSLPCSYVKRTV